MKSYAFKSGMAIDSDGSPRSYAPPSSGLVALDYLKNAGYAGNWWGIACDDHGKPYVQGQNAPCNDPKSKGYYVSTTSYERSEFAHNDTRRYLNSETEKFIVVPNSFRKSVEGIVLGCLVKVSYNGKTAQAVVGDVGPRIGEGSIALANALGIPSNPKKGGVDSGVTYEIFPGVTAPGYRLISA